MNKPLRSLLVAAASLAAASAFAEGLSVGGSVGGSHWKGDAFGGVASDSSDTGYKLWLGWGFTPNFGLEAGYVDLGKFSGPLGDLKGQGEYLDAVGSVPLGMNISALGRVGLFSGRLQRDTLGVSDSDRGLSWKAGLGLQYDLSKNLGIRGEWERYRFDALSTKADTDLYSIGVNYRF
ncbi:MAG TPA: porin family protein [Ideonella sp.]|nr:porin family protein [Ideonella sp.]